VKSLALFSILLVAVAASALALVYCKHQSRKLSGELEALRARRAALELEWHQLRLERSHLAALAEVDRKARHQLGMFVPRPDEVIYLKP
jgi:cell division protein FtsL